MKKKKHILVIDDERALLKLVKNILEPKGYKVSLAASGHSGLALMEKEHPDLIILDMKMPGLNGFQVLDLIRQRSNIPVIMLTGVIDKNILSKSLNIGADDYITKPFNPDVLVARIEAKLRRAGR
ncbi:MAG TPA: response regulator transcription factor [Dehalococcoidales bacterium]|nr:response regulator transcription factor [Dehalococcoidales bacterium]